MCMSTSFVVSRDDLDSLRLNFTNKKKTIYLKMGISLNPSFFLLWQMSNTMMKWAQEWPTCMNSFLFSLYLLYTSQTHAHLQPPYHLQQMPKPWRRFPSLGRQAKLQHQVSAPQLPQQHLTLLLSQPVNNLWQFILNEWLSNPNCLMSGVACSNFRANLEKEMRENELGCWGECKRACPWKRSANPR